MLGVRDHQIVLAERNAGPAGISESERHHAVAEDHRFLLTTVAIDDVDNLRDFLLGQKPIHQVEWNVRMTRQDREEKHAAGGGIDELQDRRALRIHRLMARLDLAVQRHGAGGQGVLDFAQIMEDHALPGLSLALDRQIVDAEHDIL